MHLLRRLLLLVATRLHKQPILSPFPLFTLTKIGQNLIPRIFHLLPLQPPEKKKLQISEQKFFFSRLSVRRQGCVKLFFFFSFFGVCFGSEGGRVGAGMAAMVVVVK